MFNRPNLFRSGCHGLNAHRQALPSISIMTLSSIAGYCLMPVETGRMLPNVTHLNEENDRCGRRGLGFDSPWQCQESQCCFCIAYDPAPFWYGFYVALLRISFIRFCLPLLCWIQHQQPVAQQQLAAQRPVAQQQHVRMLQIWGTKEQEVRKCAKTLHHCISRHHISQVVWHCCEMVILIRS